MAEEMTREQKIKVLENFHSTNAGRAYVYKPGYNPAWVIFDGEGGARLEHNLPEDILPCREIGAVPAVRCIVTLVDMGYQVMDGSADDFVPPLETILSEEDLARFARGPKGEA